ncbi:MAG TPA: CDP-alcohol phosphatidyltransferase family protein [Candidatus Korarchaeota archaeon]|nr:CDP-alcohol phosphatidyltransferase family protein [Candidatus Korarchaeota archaeon]HDI73778.1 CDP-alcohol phosphatidyltransferase family protein [Candidatus Korarchaeota archaeon]
MLEMFRDRISGFIDRIASWLVSAGMTANAVTFFGLIFTMLAFYYLYIRNNLGAAGLIILAGFSDVLDGAIARKTGKTSILGSFLDSVVDRVEDGLLLLGMGLYSGDLLLAALSIHASMLVSYIRAKAESLQVKGTQYSLTGRAERVLLAAAFCAIDRVKLGLLVIVILNYLTALERAFIFLRIARNREYESRRT